ncbi:hypothetical protein ABZ897_52845 [Nonomuraea sp. NPDC046802]|uniref:hypothetical protein n=1 Tax=Nonomuraea sp. NPDC046802 TaxID=3154919 RepID=UPI0033CA89BA
MRILFDQERDHHLSGREVHCALCSWMAAVDADDLPALRSFTHGIHRDLDAVINGLTLPHSSCFRR